MILVKFTYFQKNLSASRRRLYDTGEVYLFSRSLFASRRRLYDTGEDYMIWRSLSVSREVYLFLEEDYMILEKFICFQRILSSPKSRQTGNR